ncbi:MAG: hypothetical protein QM775_03195 [Pirellulales bacterium]
MRPTLLAILLFASGAMIGALVAAADAPPSATSATAPLRELQDLIGSWKGVGQIRRGSAEGSWQETSTWAWKFAAEESAVVFSVPQGKYVVAGRIVAGAEQGTLVLTTCAGDDASSEFVGRRDADGRWQFDARGEVDAGRPSRITIRPAAAGKRLVVLLERRNAASDSYSQLAEIGYTRVGSDFGKGSGGPKCVVTGGEGTIAVTHAGKTYYVCCSGCRELFEAEPEKVIADYEARLSTLN